MTSTVDQNQPFDPSIVVLIVDSRKGRCLQSSRVFNVGDVILEEDALIYARADYETLHHDSEELLKRAFSKVQFNQLAQYHNELANFDQVQSLDTARNLIQLVALFILHNAAKYPTDIIPDYFVKMNLLTQLGVSSLEAEEDNLSCIRQFRSMFPKLIPKNILDRDVARLLGVLNTNQHELEDFGGSGLFVRSAILEHSCYPNCSFTTINNHILVTAIRTINPGDRLTIDYANDYYSPSAQRIEYLQETYGFSCDCPACCGVDLKRAFRCPYCVQCPQVLPPSGLLVAAENLAFICPVGYDDNRNQWSNCSKCGRSCDASYLKKCLEREEHFTKNPPSIIREIEALLAEGFLHPMHHIVFVALHDLSVRLAVDARSSSSGSKSGYRLAINVTQRVIGLMNSPVMPAVHHEKVLILDKLGQLAVAAGDHALAKDSFRRAYEMCQLACGSHAPLTLDLFAISEKTPQTVEALVACYQRRVQQNADAGQEGQDMDMDTGDTNY